MKKGLMLILALTVTFAGTVSADEGNQKLLDKVANLEAKVERLEGRSATPSSAPTGTSGSFVNNPDGINLGGWVSAGYNYNWSAPAPFANDSVPAAGSANVNGTNTNIRAFDRDANSFIHKGELVLEKAATDPGTAGFRADLIFGRDAQILNATHIGDSTDNVFVEQAYVQYIAPIGNGVDIKAGRFVTIVGSEVIESKDNWNTSRSLLFQLAQPITHNGVIASYVINDLVDVKLGLANGWDSSIDNNNSKTILSQIALHPMETLDITQSYILGAEQTRTIAGSGPTDGNYTDRNLRQLLDTVVAWQPIADNERLKLLGNYDIGWEERGTSVEGVSIWQGLAVGAKYDVNDWLTLAGRWGFFNDNDGHRIGALNGITSTERNNIYEMTYTADIKLATNLITRVEWRYDWATDPIFDLSSAVASGSPDVGSHSRQSTLGAEVIYVFG